MVLLDASVWIDFFNGVEPVVTKVARLIRRDEAVVAGVSVAEVLRGIKHAQHRDEVRETMLGLRYIEEGVQTWVRVGELGRSLDASGRVLPLADLLLGSLAQELDIAIYTTDKHFLQIPHLKHHKPVHAGCATIAVPHMTRMFGIYERMPTAKNRKRNEEEEYLLLAFL